MRGPVHLRPTAELAPRVIVPGDPGRALLLAQELLDAPRMFNHHRGLWGYSGIARDGEPLTIQSTGMGGPSAAIVATELIMLGARQLLRVGTCGALEPALRLGETVAVTHALAQDGTSRLLGAGESIAADTDLAAGLMAAGATRSGVVVSSDLFYDERPERLAAWRGAGVLAIEMETATLLAVAGRRGAVAAALLIVSDASSDASVPARARIDDELLATTERHAGRIALAALAAPAGGA